MARKEDCDLQQYRNHHTSTHANKKGRKHREEENKSKHSIAQHHSGHGAQEAHRKSMAINTHGSNSEHFLGQSHNSHSKNPKSYDTTIETGVYDTEAGIFESQHKEEPRKQWWKNKYLILILVAVGAFFFIAGIATGTLLQQQNQKTPSGDASAIEEFGSSEEVRQNVAKTLNATTSSTVVSSCIIWCLLSSATYKLLCSCRVHICQTTLHQMKKFMIW